MNKYLRAFSQLSIEIGSIDWLRARRFSGHDSHDQNPQLLMNFRVSAPGFLLDFCPTSSQQLGTDPNHLPLH